MEDRMADMLLFMEKLPQELITDDINLSVMDFSGDTHLGVASTAAPPPPHNPINYPFDHHSDTTPFPPLLLPQGNLRGEGASNDEEATATSMAAMREMIFRIAAMQPVQIDPESVRPPKRKNVRISREPQSVAARHRRERISHKIRILQRLVPGGTKMDTASMLDEAIHYVKFLKTQVQSLERAALSHHAPPVAPGGVGFPVVLSRVNVGSCFPVMRTHHGGFERHYYDPSDA